MPLCPRNLTMTLSAMRARVERLRHLARGMGKEVALWKAQEGPLLPLERKKYLEPVLPTGSRPRTRRRGCWRPPWVAWRR